MPLACVQNLLLRRSLRRRLVTHELIKVPYTTTGVTYRWVHSLLHRQPTHTSKREAEWISSSLLLFSAVSDRSHCTTGICNFLLASSQFIECEFAWLMASPSAKIVPMKSHEGLLGWIFLFPSLSFGVISFVKEGRWHDRKNFSVFSKLFDWLICFSSYI